MELLMKEKSKMLIVDEEEQQNFTIFLAKIS